MRTRLCVIFARMVLTQVNVNVHSAVRCRRLVVKIAWHVLHYKIMSSHSYFEILQLMYRIYPSVTQARLQGDGVMMHPLPV